jgi:hypothetical protein
MVPASISAMITIDQLIEMLLVAHCGISSCTEIRRAHSRQHRSPCQRTAFMRLAAGSRTMPVMDSSRMSTLFDIL